MREYFSTNSNLCAYDFLYIKESTILCLYCNTFLLCFYIKPPTVLTTGDFDEYDLFGQRVSYVTVGKWLSRVLHCPNDLNGDSPKVKMILDMCVAAEERRF